jgi:hypothetical protein
LNKFVKYVKNIQYERFFCATAGWYRSAKDSAFTRVSSILTNEISTFFPHDRAFDYNTNDIPSTSVGGIIL